VTRVAVVGAGAIGGFLAAALARTGAQVAIVARGPHLEAIARDGLRVTSDLGNFSASVEATDDLRRLDDVDVLLLTFKAHQWPSFRPQLEPFAASGVSVVTLQNGLPFWYVREPPLRSVDPGGAVGRLFDDDRVIGGVVHVSGTIVAPGVVKQSGGLRYVLGAPRGGNSARVENVAALFRSAGLSPEVDRDIRSTVWLKLVNNAGLNPTSVLYGMTIKPMLADPSVRGHLHAHMIEAMRVGEAMGVVSDVDVEERIAYAARLADVKTSMLQDFERGRSLELEPIVGAVIELGERYGVAVPRLRDISTRLSDGLPAGSRQ
jgi:2-dehydropantoate 2-reductase